MIKIQNNTTATIRLNYTWAERKSPDPAYALLIPAEWQNSVLPTISSSPHNLTLSDRQEVRLVVVQDLNDRRLRVKHPLWVQLTFSEGTVTAWHYDLEELGYGDTEWEALDDFRASVAELYFLYKDEGDERLGPLASRQWGALQQLIEES